MNHDASIPTEELGHFVLRENSARSSAELVNLWQHFQDVAQLTTGQ